MQNSVNLQRRLPRCQRISVTEMPAPRRWIARPAERRELLLLPEISPLQMWEIRMQSLVGSQTAPALVFRTRASSTSQLHSGTRWQPTSPPGTITSGRQLRDSKRCGGEGRATRKKQLAISSPKQCLTIDKTPQPAATRNQTTTQIIIPTREMTVCNCHTTTAARDSPERTTDCEIDIPRGNQRDTSLPWALVRSTIHFGGYETWACLSRKLSRSDAGSFPHETCNVHGTV
jgi:hypothetical protein